MNIPKEYVKDFEAFPPVLRKLLDAELVAGNEIVEIGHGFPAPPAGAYIKLKKPLSTQPRASGGGIDFYDRNSSLYSGEITDNKRFYFLLEPPHPPEPEPDMDAIREVHRAKQSLVSVTESQAATSASTTKRSSGKESRSSAGIPKPQGKPKPAPETALEHFQASMKMNYERWHDGIGYDLEIIETSTPEERAQIENFLVQRPINDWRDVEALAALNSPRAQALLRKVLKGRNRELATAVAHYASELPSGDERTTTLVAALKETEVYGGLTQALLQVEEFHPPQVIDALFRGVLERAGDSAVHFSAMLMFLHGKAETSFDWEQRPFFLRFQTMDRTERESVFRELCEKVGVDPARYLKPNRKPKAKI